jgi:membrane-associated protease RseP (regulator of RpoE activity)
MKRAIGIILVVLLMGGCAPTHDVARPLPPATTWRTVGTWRQPRLGISVNPVTPGLREYFGSTRDVGVLVGKVIADSAADKAGLQTGDLIVAVDGQAVSSVGDIAHALAGKHGMAIPVLVLWNHQQVPVSVQLAEKSEENLGAYLDWRNDMVRQWLGLYERRDEMERLEKRLQELEERVEQLEQR